MYESIKGESLLRCNIEIQYIRNSSVRNSAFSLLSLQDFSPFSYSEEHIVSF